MNKDHPLLVFIAGENAAPSLAEMADNIHRAMMLGVEVAKLGGMPITPHANTPLPFTDLQTKEFWYRGVMALLLVCDVLVLRDGWGESKGAKEQQQAAIGLKMPVFFADPDGQIPHLAAYIDEHKKGGE